MIDWALLEPVQLIDPAIFWDKGNEVRVTVGTNVGLTFIDCLNVLLPDFLAVLENIGSRFTVFVHCFLTELVEERVRFDQLWVLFLSVESDVEKSNCPAGIDGVLLHVKNV